MKKLLVLSLVLGIAAFSNAALKLTVDEVTGSTASFAGDFTTDGSLSVSAVLANASNNYAIKFTAGEGVSLVTAGTTFPGAGSTWMFGNGFTGVPTATEAVLSGGSFMAVAADTAAFSGLVINGKGMLTIVETLEDGVTKVTSQVNLVPEPMTMGLLGLGALFIRKRK